ncbi:hypothetical protein Tco_1486130, partial [Tanacetum coccineum]
MILENDGVVSKSTKEKVNSLALKAKVIREQTNDDNDSQGGSDEDEEINLMVMNFKKFFRKGNQLGVEIDLVVVVIDLEEAVLTETNVLEAQGK